MTKNSRRFRPFFLGFVTVCTVATEAVSAGVGVVKRELPANWFGVISVDIVDRPKQRGRCGGYGGAAAK